MAHPVLDAASAIDVALKSVADVNPTFMSPADKAAALEELSGLDARMSEWAMRILAEAGDVAEAHAAHNAAEWLAARAHVRLEDARADLELGVALDRRWSVLAGQCVAASAPAPRHRSSRGRSTSCRATWVPTCWPAPRRCWWATPPTTARVSSPGSAAASSTWSRPRSRTRWSPAPRCPRGRGPPPHPAHDATLRRRHDSPRRSGARRGRVPLGDIPRGVHQPAPGHRTDRRRRLRPTPLRAAAGRRVLPAARVHRREPTAAARRRRHHSDRDRRPRQPAPRARHRRARRRRRVPGAETPEVPITAAEARRLACSAHVVPAVLGGRSEVLDLGRGRRLFAGAQREALLLRDRHCRAESCEIPGTWCEAHHWIPWSSGGRTDLADGVLLCHHHHRWVHDSSYRAERLANGDVRFARRT